MRVAVKSGLRPAANRPAQGTFAALGTDGHLLTTTTVRPGRVIELDESLVDQLLASMTGVFWEATALFGHEEHVWKPAEGSDSVSGIHN
jgi:hypothetical protein